LKLAALLQFTYPGVPFLYYGDEVGMDLNSLAFRAGMYWDPGRQDHDLRAFYRRLIHIRKENPALSKGDFAEILVDNERGLYGFRRRSAGQEIQVYVNNSEAEQVLPIEAGGVELLGGRVLDSPQLALGPKSGVVIRY
jgi:glycosidase